MSDQVKSDQPNSGRPEAAGRATDVGADRLSAGRIAAIAALLGAVIFVCVNIISAQVLRTERIDLTQQRLYSLSQGTRTLLGELKEPLRFRLFMSSGLDQAGAAARGLRGAGARLARRLCRRFQRAHHPRGHRSAAVLGRRGPRRRVRHPIVPGHRRGAAVLRPRRDQLDHRPLHHQRVRTRPRDVPGVRPHAHGFPARQTAASRSSR